MLIITFHNDGTGTEKVSNYDWAVFINKLPIAKGRIENHQRKTGWEGLLKNLIKTLPNKKKHSVKS